ncbi:BQ2448_752 [Microbotryum intermedium]|uniref:BQ2448_752 protein n=1 Tax=Microbotryum intermedium TaxID=269621 RepID=A0A238F946_9BASI|nr:BQ2448_752 [Microbotryum intermedium]
MAPPAPYQVVLCETSEDEKRCLDIRIEVFIEEQGFSMEDELDEKDPGADHLILVDTETKQDVGTIRWYPPMNKLGRLAVKKKYRGIGAGELYTTGWVNVSECSRELMGLESSSRAGKWLVEALEDHLKSRKGKAAIANEGKDKVLIVANAQIYAEKFYNKCGYEAEGVPFMEDSAPHLRIVKTNLGTDAPGPRAFLFLALAHIISTSLTGRELSEMGFCQRCGEITVTPRCKCGGTAKETSTQLLFRGSTGDKWSQSWAPLWRALLLPIVVKLLHRKLPRRVLPFDHPSNGTIPRSRTTSFRVYSAACSAPRISGSVPRASIASSRFEEVIYPHPNAKTDAQLSELYFCRECFAERFSKGTCKKCKCAVLSDAPFIKHEDRLWHESCYSCSYCSDPQTGPVIDFSGNPSCETCFDNEAYKTQGVPPSPHLAQKGFDNGPVKANLRPAPSKWGAKGKLNLSPAVKPTAQTKYGQDNMNTAAGNSNSVLLTGHERAVPGWRLQNEREKSPIVASLDELGNTFRRLGLERSESPRASLKRPEVVTQSNTLPSSASPTYDTDAGRNHIGRNATTRTAPIWSQVSPASKNLEQKESARTESTHCSICKLELGYGEFVRLQGRASVMHKACFVCGGCRKPLDQGRHVDAKGQIWHHDCAPAPNIFRTIETSLAEPQQGQPSRSYVPSTQAQDPCRGCGFGLGLGYNITTSNGSANYHARCFKCAACSQLFGGTPSDRSFVEMGGLPYHARCAPSPSHKRTEENPSTPLRASTSRAPSTLPLALSQAKIFHTPPSTNSTEKPRSIFATRERPPENLGGLLVCAGCSVRATERETKSGPLGKRYHPRCLKCGLCSRSVDSESRIGANGELRCESCRVSHADRKKT